MLKKIVTKPYFIFLLAILGLLLGLTNNSFLYVTCNIIADIFIRVLQLVSIPVVTFSLLSTITGIDSWFEFKNKTLIIIKYTIITTISAGFIAWLIYQIIDPCQHANDIMTFNSSGFELPKVSLKSLLDTFLPNNILEPFVKHNVIGVMFISFLISLAILKLPFEKRKTLNELFDSLFQTIMVIIAWLIKLMPIAVFAFMVLFIKELKSGLSFSKILLYLSTIILANLSHALITLPMILKAKKISPKDAFKYFYPALSIAFFSKSSVCAMPVAMMCADKMGLESNNSRFSFPLCTTINMNACAAFILITVLFVADINGVKFDLLESFIWIFIATLAAIGNAGVPMGCFFLSGALLSAMNIPIEIMGIILPFYALLDMLESAINVWSDAVVSIIFDKESKNKKLD